MGNSRVDEPICRSVPDRGHSSADFYLRRYCTDLPIASAAREPEPASRRISGLPVQRQVIQLRLGALSPSGSDRLDQTEHREKNRKYTEGDPARERMKFLCLGEID
jgi:hypothetical protein